MIRGRSTPSIRCAECLEKQRVVEANRPERDRTEWTKEYEARPETIAKRAKWTAEHPEAHEAAWRRHRAKKLAEDPEGYRKKGAERQAARRAVDPEAAKERTRADGQTLNGRRGTTIRSAEARGIPYELTDDQFKVLSFGDCFYCGHKAQKGALNGIDRLDSALPYIIDNVRSCCSDCNMSKGTLSLKLFIVNCARVAHFHTLSNDALALIDNIPYSSPGGSSFNIYLRRARRKNFEFALSEQDYDAIVTRNCYLCGNRPDPICGIDRKDNKFGYTLENSEPCCYNCNMLKRETPLSQFVTRCIRIVDHFTKQPLEISEPETLDSFRTGASVFKAPKVKTRLLKREETVIIAKARNEMPDYFSVVARVKHGKGSAEDHGRLKKMDAHIEECLREGLEEKLSRLTAAEGK